MITRRHLLAGSAAVLALPHTEEVASAQEPAAKVTILFDAFGKPSDLKRGWGYSAFIEYGGRRILFDTGAKSADFAHNAQALGVDLKRLDLVVLTHRHNDHTGGLNHVLRENPGVTVYTPVEGAGFNSQIPPGLMGLIQRYVATVPEELRYFGGKPPTEIRPEAPWQANFVQITQPSEILPGCFLFSTRSTKPGTMEMNEISLLMKTPKGSTLFVGCSHPGIERIVEAAAKIDPQLYAVFGGFHLVDISDAEVTELATALRDKWRIERMAAGHCTGQFAFAELSRVFGPRFDRAGVGAVIPLPT
jgi:7,8-dihydropterin-6-yl-methyl-4-(beta-D-ribofuranosyl)aminobenzene 5'-phosphate synthase